VVYHTVNLHSRSIRIEWDNCRGGRFTIRCKEGGYSRAIKLVRERNVEVGEIEDCYYMYVLLFYIIVSMA
jgi:hypothetical protein